MAHLLTDSREGECNILGVEKSYTQAVSRL